MSSAIVVVVWTLITTMVDRHVDHRYGWLGSLVLSAQRLLKNSSVHHTRLSMAVLNCLPASIMLIQKCIFDRAVYISAVIDQRHRRKS